MLAVGALECGAEVPFERENNGCMSDIHLASIGDVTAEALEQMAPDLVVSPLFCSAFDCYDLAARLAGLGFCGRYRAFVDALPDPGLIRREIARAFPGLDFDVLLVDAAQVGRMN
ncbi:MAG: hypothetical protein CR993_02660 [Rhodobacterales bacterium]|nr:MAG: hypothetical protein CR993_02660 [Rhodobacterales bacterium]